MRDGFPGGHGQFARDALHGKMQCNNARHQATRRNIIIAVVYPGGELIQKEEIFSSLFVSNTGKNSDGAVAEKIYRQKQW